MSKDERKPQVDSRPVKELPELPKTEVTPPGVIRTQEQLESGGVSDSEVRALRDFSQEHKM